MNQLKIIVFCAVIIWCFYLVYYTYSGILNPIVSAGDGRDYHIPISQSILNGTFLHPEHFKLMQWYYPGSAEAFNSILILLHIPLTLSNLFPIVILAFALFKLGMTFRLNYYSSILFAITFVTLNVLVRWYIAVSIDVWLAVFFVFSIILLEKPEKTYWYAARLGFVLGMLIGSKYTADYFIVLLILVYIKNIWKVLSLTRFTVFLIPFSLFGLFWYVRNYIYMQNPFYPMPMLGFKGQMILLNDTISTQLLSHTGTMLNAYFGEYNIWSFLIFIAFGVYVYKKVRNKKLSIYGINRVYIIGIVNFLLFLTFPTNSQPWIMVSSFRYSLPTFIPLILGVFMVCNYYKKDILLGFSAIGSMLMVLTMSYYPKLTIFYILLAFILMYIIEKKEKKYVTGKASKELTTTIFH